MNIQHEILEFFPQTASISVRYFADEVPTGLVYNIDLPVNNGTLPSQQQINELVEHNKPVGQLERIAAANEATVPSHLSNYVAVQLPDGSNAFIVPAQYGDAQFTPTVDQDGKDTSWLPAPPFIVQKMYEMANITSNDVVYDLGSGTGSMLIGAALQFGATCVGVEYNTAMVNLATRKAAAANVSDKVSFVQGDFLQEDISTATVVLLYLTPELNLALKSKLQALPSGSRIVSYASGMGDWAPSKTMTIGALTIYEWTIGA